MKINTVDLVKELQKSKKKYDILDEVDRILSTDIEEEKRITDSLKKKGTLDSSAIDQLDRNNIYSLDQIKDLCIKYRLRFLDSTHFKGEIPYEAITKIKQLEKETGTELKNFKIVAPKELFNLEDKDSDPLLFLQLSANKFYFIHKWGGELNRFRSILAFPMRSFMNMFWFLLVVAFLFSLLVTPPSLSMFAFLVVHSFIAICGIACLLVFSQRENFSNVEWDSKFLS